MDFTWIRVTGDQVVSPNPSKVGTVIVTPEDASGNAVVTLYDGESTGDPQIVAIRTRQGITRQINFQPYLETQRGLYVDVGSNVEEVLIQLKWEKE